MMFIDQGINLTELYSQVTQLCLGFALLNLREREGQRAFYGWSSSSLNDLVTWSGMSAHVSELEEPLLIKGVIRSNLFESREYIYPDSWGGSERWNGGLQQNGGRPDSDGYLTYEESVYWYRHGNGQPLNVDLGRISVKGLYVSSFNGGVGSRASVNLIMKASGWDMMMNTKAWNDAKVYGNLTFRLYLNNQVKAFQDKYDFEMHSWYNPLNWPRNAATIYGERQVGIGTPYKINFRGTLRIPSAPLPVR